MLLIFCINVILFVSGQIVNVVPNGEGHGSLIVCPNGDSILYNFRKMAQYEPPAGYYNYILDEAYPPWREKTKYVIVSGPEQSREILHVMKELQPYGENIEKLFLQGKREYYKSSKGLGEADDLVDYIFKNFPFLDYQFYEDEDYFKKFDFCDDSAIEFVLMNVRTYELPKLNYYRRNIHRGWSLKIKNYRSKKSMFFIQDIESIEQKNLHQLMKRYHETSRSHVLQLSHYNPADHTKTNLFKEIKPKMIISQNGCPKATNAWTPKCEVFEKAVKSGSLKIVENHSILCCKNERRIRVNGFNRAIYSTIPNQDWINSIRYNLNNLTYDVIPIVYEGRDGNFKHPCGGYSGNVEVIDGLKEFLMFMKDPEYLEKKKKIIEEEERKERNIDIEEEEEEEEESRGNEGIDEL